MQRAILGRDDRRLVCPVLVEAPLFPEKDVDQFRIKRTQAAEDDEQMVAGDDGGRVELQTADRTDQLVDVVSRDWFRARPAQPLASNRQAPSVLDPDLSTHSGTMAERRRVASRRA
jgi:hypothetical protein